MAAKKTDLVIGVFDHPTQAEQALAELRRAGFPPDRIDLATAAPAADDAGETLPVPGVGRVLRGGILSALLRDATVPSASFLGLFAALDLPEEDADYYARALQDGRTVVLVRTPDRRDEARALLNRHAAHDRESQRPDGSYL